MAQLSDFIHGVDSVEIDSAPQPIRTAKSSVIGFVGTSPIGPVNDPTLILGSRRDSIAAFGQLTAKAEAQGFTLPRALDMVFEPGGCTVVVVNVFDPTDENNQAEQTDTVSFSSSSTASLSKGFLLLAGFTMDNSISAPFTISAAGVAPTLPAGCTLVKVYDEEDNIIGPDDYDTELTLGRVVKVEYTAALSINVDYTVNLTTGVLTRISGGKIIPLATVEASYTYLTASEIDADVVVGTQANRTGVYALLNSKVRLGVQPRIIAAPGYTEVEGETITEKGPVAAACEVVAGILRGVPLIDLPSVGEDDTTEKAVALRSNYGIDRTIVIYPHVKVAPKYVSDAVSVAAPSSAIIAGLISRVDNDSGFWRSPSNHQIPGIMGLVKDIDFAHGDPNTLSNYLNSNNICTIIREDGFRFWGNRTVSGMFINKRRTADMIEESILVSHMWAVDQNISRGLVEAVVEGVNEYLRRLEVQGAILGGRAWADPDVNTKAVLASGQLIIDYEFTGPTPAERITFRARLTDGYIVNIFPTGADATVDLA